MIAMFALGLVLKIPPVWLVEVEIGLKLMHSRQCLAVFAGDGNFIAVSIRFHEGATTMEKTDLVFLEQ